MWWRRLSPPSLSWRSPGVRSFSLPYSDSPRRKGKVAPLQERRMVDRFRLWAKGGEGGSGCCSVRRSRTDRHGKADGGNGGRGGDVILECSAAVWDFSNLQHHLNAKKGGHGVSKNQIGSCGADKVAQAPVGTVIHLVSGERPSFLENTSIASLDPWDIPGAVEANPSKSVQELDNRVESSGLRGKEDLGGSPSRLKDDFSQAPHHALSEFNEVECGEYMKISHPANMESWEKESEEDAYEVEWEEEEEYEEEGEEVEEVVQYSVAELTEPGQRILVARGGEGGLGNAALKKDNKPRKHINYDDGSSLTAGRPGSESVLILELKSIADVGLVGMPNAGKSTLLGALSRAKPAVGSYAFTTLRPNIGNLNYEDFFSVKVADIPGLIKGAHENRGLGHAFLRHIERTKVLAYVVDLAAALNGKKGISPWEQLRDLVLELEHHQEGLSNRPSLIVANKIDEEGANDVYEELKRRVQGVPIFPVCAVLREGVPALKAGLRRLMDGSMSRGLDFDRIIVD